MMTGHEALAERVRRVAEARSDEASAKAQLAERQARFDAENAALIDEVRDLKERREQAESLCKHLVLAHFKESGEKKPVPGVEVKEKTSLLYDPEQALAWARETKLALLPESLDVKAFEKIAKVTKLGFVSELVEPQAQIAGDLTKALGAEVAS